MSESYNEFEYKTNIYCMHRIYKVHTLCYNYSITMARQA